MPRIPDGSDFGSPVYFARRGRGGGAGGQIRVLSIMVVVVFNTNERVLLRHYTES
jgi:hypothetical protein